MKETVKVSERKLEEENKELRIVLRKLCHEMGNALTLLGGSIYYLENEIKDGKEKSVLSDVREDYRYLCALFGNLREYNHHEGLNKAPISLSTLEKNIKSAINRFNINDSIQIIYEGIEESDYINIYADVTKLQQALVNIIKNSMEAMEDNAHDKGKKLCIVMSIEDDKSLGEVVHLQIKDNGKGISKSSIKEIFEPMYTYGKKQGTGLGLAVVKKIIEDHRGKIEAVSILGTGTAIHIYLPLAGKSNIDTK